MAKPYTPEELEEIKKLDEIKQKDCIQMLRDASKGLAIDGAPSKAELGLSILRATQHCFDFPQLLSKCEGAIRVLGELDKPNSPVSPAVREAIIRLRHNIRSLKTMSDQLALDVDLLTTFMAIAVGLSTNSQAIMLYKKKVQRMSRATRLGDRED